MEIQFRPRNEFAGPIPLLGWRQRKEGPCITVLTETKAHTLGALLSYFYM